MVRFLVHGVLLLCLLVSQRIFLFAAAEGYALPDPPAPRYELPEGTRKIFVDSNSNIQVGFGVWGVSLNCFKNPMLPHFKHPSTRCTQTDPT